MKKRLTLCAIGMMACLGCLVAQDIGRGFRHPGGLHTQADFDRVKQQLDDGNELVTAAYNVLKDASYAQSSAVTNPVETIVRGGSGENYMNAARGASIAYQNALRWKIEGNKSCAKHAVDVLMQWARKTKNVTGNSDQYLAYGLYGYEFAQAAELMRDYEGWSREDFHTFQRWMLEVWYPGCVDFARRRNGTWENSGKWWQAPGHYWSNWSLANDLALLSIGVLCDDVFIYNQGLACFKLDQVGTYNEAERQQLIATGGTLKNDGLTDYWPNLIVTCVPWTKESGAYGMVGQMNESGRDTGHCALALGLVLDVAKMVWNQGDDLFAFMDHRLAAAVEYVAAQCLSEEGLPWTNYHYATNGFYYTDSRSTLMTAPALGAQLRPYWGTAIGIYEGVKGVTMPFAKRCYALMGIDGGGQGSTSGGYDHLGYSVLMNTHDGINACPPTELRGQMTYKEKVYDQNMLGGTKIHYTTTALAQRALPAGSVVTLIPLLPEGTADTGLWQWNTGEQTRELTVTANESRLYRVTYTNEQGVKSEQCFTIAVSGDCFASRVTPFIQVNSKTIEGQNLTVRANTSVTLSITCPDGYGTYQWTTADGSKQLGTAQSKTLKVTKDTVIVGNYINQGGRYCPVRFCLLVTDEELTSDTQRKVEPGNYLIRYRYTDQFLTNVNDTATLMPRRQTDEDSDDELTQVWFINRTETGSIYSLTSLVDSMSLNTMGLLKSPATKVHRITLAQGTDYCIFSNSNKAYWVVDETGTLRLGATNELYDYPFELIALGETQDVSPVRMDYRQPDDVFYDLSGRRMDARTASGIGIACGKKVLF